MPVKDPISGDSQGPHMNCVWGRGIVQSIMECRKPCEGKSRAPGPPELPCSRFPVGGLCSDRGMQCSGWAGRAKSTLIRSSGRSAEEGVIAPVLQQMN